MMDVIVRGEPQEIDFVRRVCRDKVRRGMLAILPATRPVCDEVVKLKNERDEISLKLHESESRIKELEDQLLAITNVPENTEAVLEIEENAENADENVPENTETVPETVLNDSDSMEDNKYVAVEDMTEVNLDDVKDAPDEDSTDAPAPTPKRTRRKTTE